MALSLILALTLCCSIFFTACNKVEYLGFEGYYNTELDKEFSGEALKSANSSIVLREYDTPYIDGNIAYIENSDADVNEKKFVVINLDTGAEVYSLTKEPIDAGYSQNASIEQINGNNVIVETFSSSIRSEKTITIYTALGQRMASGTERSSSYFVYTDLFEVKNGLVIIDNKAYTFEDDILTEKFDLGFGDMPDCEIVTDNYNYEIVYSEYDYDYDYDITGVNVYNANYKFVARYEKPAYVESMNVNVLADGNLLIQLMDEVPASEKKYDYISQDISEDGYSAKYQLTTLIYNIGKKETKEIDLDYIVFGITNKLTAKEDDNALKFNKVENLVAMYPIVDKMLDRNQLTVASMTSKGEVVGLLAKEVYEQIMPAELVSNNRFTVEDKLGKTYLINEKGKLIGEITGAKIVEDNECYYIKLGKKYYDMDLKLVMDLSTISYQQDSGSVYYTSYNSYDGIMRYEYYSLYNKQFIKLNIPNTVSPSNVYGGNNYITYTESLYSSSLSNKVVLNLKGEEVFRRQTGTVRNDSTNTTSTTSVHVSGSGNYAIIAVEEYIYSYTSMSSSSSCQYYIVK